MTPTFRRRDLVALALAAPVLGLAGRARAEPVLGDVILGAEDAPVTVIEYASFTCPHCAAFHVDTFPRLREEYVDTGRVRFILREVYFDRFGLWASMVARCGGERGFYPISSQLMARQDAWARAEDPAAEIRRIGRMNGLGAGEIEACLSDQAYAESLVERYQETAAADDVRSTPTFIVNGEKHTGNMPFEDFAAILDRALAG